MTFRKLDSKANGDQHAMPGQSAEVALSIPKENVSVGALPVVLVDAEYEMFLACLDEFEEEHIFVRDYMENRINLY